MTLESRSSRIGVLAEEAFKASAYNHIVTSFFDGRYLAFNALSGAFLTLDDEELQQTDDLLACVEDTGDLPSRLTPIQQLLVDSGFVVAAECDELQRIHKRYYQPRQQVKGLSLTVTTTVSCNFDCGYCFQSHANRPIRKHDAEKVKTFAAEHLAPGTNLSVTWFGGEPLAAFDVIENLAPYFASLAQERNCSFYHAIITNGSLLTPERARWLASIPRFGYAQITLDGPPAYHDRRRPALGGQGTFDKILSNIKAAADLITISIRVNVDRRNVDGLEELLHILRENGLHERIGIYLGHVWEYTEHVEESGFLSTEEFAQVQTQFQFLKFRLGFRTGAKLPVPRSGSQCVADNPNGYVIAPDGLLFKCWNEIHMPAPAASGRYDGRHELLHIQSMENNRQRWAAYDPFTHTPCQTCPVAPLCMSGCPWESRKSDQFHTGFCTPLRFNLADQLRLYHFETTVHRAISHPGPAEPEVDACTDPVLR